MEITNFRKNEYQCPCDQTVKWHFTALPTCIDRIAESWNFTVGGILKVIGRSKSGLRITYILIIWEAC